MDREIDETLKHAINNANKAWEDYQVGAIDRGVLMKRWIDFTATVGEVLRKIHQQKHKKNNILPFPKERP